MIRGEAGGGKSTLLQWLAITAPEQFLTGVADPIIASMPGSWVSEQLAGGRALLLVDGVDELPIERRPRVRTWLRDLLAAFPEMLVVVTSRPPAAPVRWLEADGFDSLTPERLAPADVRALIDQWHRAARTSPSLPSPAVELVRYENKLAASQHLYRLAGSPLMAAMLCALNLDRQTHLPPDRMAICRI
ncbi:NACHT domain-containing protein [Actinoplanes sp. NPDC051861]|uniref:NACHT domain-containing protein n=1 Tax=Actinoplanes sp. NPDC051861 TaxID=3155170 RepID=UPI00342AE840